MLVAFKFEPKVRVELGTSEIRSNNDFQLWRHFKYANTYMKHKEASKFDKGKSHLENIKKYWDMPYVYWNPIVKY